MIPLNRHSSNPSFFKQFIDQLFVGAYIVANLAQMLPIVLTFLLFSVWSWFISLKRIEGRPFLIGFWLKFLGGCTFVWVYSHYYGEGTLTADPADFMKDSKELYAVSQVSVLDYLKFIFGFEDHALILRYLSKTHHWSAGDLILINDNQNVLRVNSLVFFISNGTIYVHIIIFSWLSTLGLRLVYHWLAASSYWNPRLIWYALVLFPSCLFWTGSVLKEPFMLIGLCLFLVALFDRSLPRIRKRVFFALGLLLMLMFKPYVGCVAFIAFVLFKFGQFLKLRTSLVFVCSALLVHVFMLFNSSVKTKIVHYLSRKQFDFVNIGRGGLHAYSKKEDCFYFFEPKQFSNFIRIGADSIQLTKSVHCKLLVPGRISPFKSVYLKPSQEKWWVVYESPYCESFISVPLLKEDYFRVISSIPIVCFNVLFRPLPGDPGGALKYLAMLETFCLFGFFAYSIFRRQSIGVVEKDDFLGFILVFVLCLSCIIGWVTPVLGAIVRYRIPIYFVLLCALFKERKKRVEQYE